MILDITTKNSVYNVSSHQAQWVSHRWGPRTYPDADLAVGDLKRIIRKYGNGTIDIVCMYGDPAEYPEFETLCQSKIQTLNINSYGLFSDDQIELLNSSKDINTIIHLDGWNDSVGKVFLGVNADNIINSLTNIHNIKVIYHTYKHNEIDISDFCEFAAENRLPVEFKPGFVADETYQSVIDRSSAWLYDIYKSDIKSDWLFAPDKIIEFGHNLGEVEWCELEKSLPAFSSLRTYIKSPAGRGILNSPIVPKVVLSDSDKHQIVNEIKIKNNTYVTPTGHIFHNHELGVMFMLLLAKEWTLSMSEARNYDDYKLYILYVAQYLLEQGIDKFLITTQSALSLNQYLQGDHN